MNSIRPLVTITILAVVGAWLYVKINQGPARPGHGESEHSHEAAVDIPPLSAAPAAPQAERGAAPKWPGTTATAPSATTLQPAPATLQPTPQTTGATGLPEMPAIPALPDVANSPQPTPPAATSSAPLAPPVDIPTARYPDAASTSINTSADSATASAGTTTPSVPLNPVTPDATIADAAPATSSPAAPSATADHETAVATDSAMAAIGLTPQPQSTQPPAAGTDRYAPSAASASALTATPDAATLPVEPSFVAAWPEIQAALDRGELARAHQLLSRWYGDSSLTPAEVEQVNALLAQLAGTVVYSTEHQLEPAYVVRPGDTLDSIAKQYNVPWQLLAKVNGIPSANAVQPGQSLKVIRGPFSAVVDLSRSQLTLMLDGRYAGKFPISVPTGAPVSEGQWLVGEKLVTAPASVAQTSYAPATAAVERAIVLRGEDASTGKPAATGPILTIASAPLTTGTVGAPPSIRISPQDAEELSDILSVGSRVTIRR